MMPLHEQDLVLRNRVLFGQDVDWLTLLALFLVAAFLVVPQLVGYAVTARARFCLLGAVWLLLIKLLLRLMAIVLLCVEMFSLRTGSVPLRGGGADSFGGMLVEMLFPILEGGTLLVAMVLFAMSLTNLLRRKERWESEDR
jgi:hypothetical protein